MSRDYFENTVVEVGYRKWQEDPQAAIRPVSAIDNHGVLYESDDWTGTATDYLRIPWAGGTPEYISESTYETDYSTQVSAPDPADSSDTRNEYCYIQISRTPGAVWHVPLR